MCNICKNCSSLQNIQETLSITFSSKNHLEYMTNSTCSKVKTLFNLFFDKHLNFFSKITENVIWDVGRGTDSTFMKQFKVVRLTFNDYMSFAISHLAYELYMSIVSITPYHVRVETKCDCFSYLL